MFINLSYPNQYFACPFKIFLPDIIPMTMNKECPLNKFELGKSKVDAIVNEILIKAVPYPS